MGVGGGVMRWGEGEFMHIATHCHHQNDSCIKMDGEERHFNVSLTARAKVIKTASTDHNS